MKNRCYEFRDARSGNLVEVSCGTLADAVAHAQTLLAKDEERPIKITRADGVVMGTWYGVGR